MSIKMVPRCILIIVCFATFFWLVDGWLIRPEHRGIDDPSLVNGKNVARSKPAEVVVKAPPHHALRPADKAEPAKSAPIPPLYSRVYPSPEKSEGRNWHDFQTNNLLDRLKIVETLSEDWPQGRPTVGGWYPRVRIVKTSFKSGVLRIEENVEVKVEAGTMNVLRSRIQSAVDAKYVLVSSVYASELAAQKIHSQAVKNPNYLKVSADSPWLVSSIPTLIAKLKNLGMREIEADSIIAASASTNDPLIFNGVAWHLENLGLLPGHQAGSDIGAPVAWDRQTDASSVLIALIDSGIVSSDSELIRSMYAFPRETLGDGIDNDGNGYIDDALGYDFYRDDSNPEDEAGHGSLCAALIGATGNNAFGSTGVAWKASILNCKFLNEQSLGVLSDAIDAVDYARNSGARIINLSWGYYGDAALLKAALARCDTAGILMVCASGNAGSFAPVPVPASIDLPHLLVVAASTPSDRLASFSVVDPNLVDLAAPGVDLPVALHSHPNNPEQLVIYPSGTSFSAALVSGSLALGLSEYPSETPKQMIRRMLESVDPIPGGAAGLSSGGRLNLAKMLTTVVSTPHDLFAKRLILTDASGKWTGRNNGASAENLDLSLGLSPPPQRTTWFEWTASSDGLLRFSAKAIDGTPVRLAAFTSSNGLPASLLAQSTNGGAIEISVVAGQKMLWMLDSAIPITQGLTLSWQLPPANDNWLNATRVSGLPLSFSGNSLGATVESFELTEPYYPWLPVGSVWWKWTPGISANIFLRHSPDHLVFLRPLVNDIPSFSLDTLVLGYDDQYSVELGQSYAVLVIPISTAGAGDFNVTITAAEDFAIIQQPVDTRALAGETVELEVIVATNKSTFPSFQWYRNGEAIPFTNSSKLRISPGRIQTSSE